MPGLTHRSNTNCSLTLFVVRTRTWGSTKKLTKSRRSVRCLESARSIRRHYCPFFFRLCGCGCLAIDSCPGDRVASAGIFVEIFFDSVCRSTTSRNSPLFRLITPPSTWLFGLALRATLWKVPLAERAGFFIWFFGARPRHSLKQCESACIFLFACRLVR